MTARQPLLHEAVVTICAPTQAWSDADGDIGSEPIHGVYHGDTRLLRRVSLEVADCPIDGIACVPEGADRVTFVGLLRALGGQLPDPTVRVLRERSVAPGTFTEKLVVQSHRQAELTTRLSVRLTPEFAPMQEVKGGVAIAAEWKQEGETLTDGTRHIRLEAAGAEVAVDGRDVLLSWSVQVPPRSETTLHWSAEITDPTLVVAAPRSDAPRVRVPETDEPRLQRWLEQARRDLDALRLVLPDNPNDVFFAAGAPWFLTLFGRDSIWAARLLLPLNVELARSTLRILARLQGKVTDPESAQASGKMPHELRSDTVRIVGENTWFPALYYGSVDATPLWVCLLADAHDAGMPESDVRELLPALRSALTWITERGDSSGHGFVDYVDESGHGLKNQGWKDSGDSIQWRDGRLAEGPIALCEVQGYAYEAAMRGADLLEALGEDGPDGLRAWARDLGDRFRERYWVTTEEGRYPAVAVDAHGDPVDSLTSNIGHLLGTGILTPEEERQCADLLLGPSMATGFGVRTLSDGAAGFWPLSYHGGSVWAHDTAIAIHGMMRCGLHDHAARLVDQLLAAAEGFGYRMPELYSGDSLGATPIPYPSACRPQAWSAAAAVVCALAREAARA
ncbi:MAG TPA: glycogen debranching N-terminal domain-containing protein [Acidimicrobiia bacterium]